MAIGFSNEGVSSLSTLVGPQHLGFGIRTGLLNIGDSYTTGGEAVVIGDFLPTGEDRVDTLADITCGISVDGAVIYVFDKANAKVLGFNTSDGAEVTATTDLSAAGKSCRATIFMT